MKKIIASASSIACFMFMPLLVIAVIVMTRLHLISEQTDVPDWISIILNWRMSAGGFLISALGGVLVCALLMTIHALWRRSGRIGTATRTGFGFFAGLIKNNFLFWAGNLLAYDLAAQYLTFIEPIPSLAVFAALMLLCAAAVQFLAHQIDKELFATAQLPVDPVCVPSA